MKSLAVLDAIICPEWEYRYHAFDTHWSAIDEMGSIRNGSGDEVFVLFTPSGSIVFNHVHEHKPEGVRPDDYYAKIPEHFQDAFAEPAFSSGSASHCFWRTQKSRNWQSASPIEAIDPEGLFLLRTLDGMSPTYLSFAKEYFEIDLDADPVRRIYHWEPMTESLARSISKDITYSELLDNMDAVGYPFETS